MLPSRMQSSARRGAATVEFALLVPVFVLFMLGLIEFGRAMMVQHTLEEAARAGCRMAVLDGATTEQVESIVASCVAASGITVYSVTVNPDPPSEATFGNTVTVTVTTLYNDVSWLPAPWFMKDRAMVGLCILPAEGSIDDLSVALNKDKNSKS